MSKRIEEAEKVIHEAVSKNQIISVKTYFLSDYGEKLLHTVVETILKQFDRIDLLEVCYSASKELVINATKANLKRVLFKEKGMDITDPVQYETGLKDFKSNLVEDKMVVFKSKFKEFDFPVVATFYYTKDVLNIKVKNNFPLLPIEESRIRAKFQKAISFSSLIDFFMEHGDETEGAGMGITMVGILLDQSGIDKHAFSLYSSKKYNETIAKLEIPLTKDYVPKRNAFDKELNKHQVERDQLRDKFTYTYKDYPKYFDDDETVIIETE